MGELVTAITAGLTPAVFYGQITALVPFLIVLVPVALGFYIFRKLVKGAAKGKVKF